MALVIVRVLVGGMLAWAIAGKLRAPAASRAALANLGLRTARARSAAWTLSIAVEAVLVAVVVAGPRPTLLLPAAVLAVFGVVLARAIRRGAAGQACGCFGARSTISWLAVARNGALAALLATAALVPGGRPDADVVQWIVIAILVLLVAALAIALLALAREVGALRIAVGSTGVALELEHEGPPVGSRHDVTDWVQDGHAGLAVAVFVSAGCAMCQGLGPAVAYLAQDPWLQVATFDEEEHQPQWLAFAVPGSPYAVVLEADGTVVAKGTFNGLPQLEGLVASGARRRSEVLVDA
ncbi:hypothetical protein DSM112329_01843 [Paraconexibacter sp. AEG42_29]|uniref:Methylamine utilisation protein MauE domain-containing protein n=1 Tax=Paraconexibacter sp. AEG42_29 TaxID=2997339 RepID=A0AAU7AU32_9ACTN